jgi:hypothetical protein
VEKIKERLWLHTVLDHQLSMYKEIEGPVIIVYDSEPVGKGRYPNGVLFSLVVQPKYRRHNTKLFFKHLVQYRYHLIKQNILYSSICLVLVCQST